MSPTEEQYAFFHELGAAIAQWALVESALQNVLVRCSKGNGGDAASMAIGFRTIENFRSKLAYVDAIVTARCFFEEAMLDRWAKLSAQISAAASKRNELVHRQAVLDPRGGVGKRIVLVEGGWYLKPRIDTGQETPNKINI